MNLKLINLKRVAFIHPRHYKEMYVFERWLCKVHNWQIRLAHFRIRQTSTESVTLHLIFAVWGNSPLELCHFLGLKMTAPTKTPEYRVLSKEHFNVWSCFIRISTNKRQLCNENSTHSTNDTISLRRRVFLMSKPVAAPQCKT